MISGWEKSGRMEASNDKCYNLYKPGNDSLKVVLVETGGRQPHTWIDGGTAQTDLQCQQEGNQRRA